MKQTIARENKDTVTCNKHTLSNNNYIPGSNEYELTNNGYALLNNKYTPLYNRHTLINGEYRPIAFMHNNVLYKYNEGYKMITENEVLKNKIDKMIGSVKPKVIMAICNKISYENKELDNIIDALESDETKASYSSKDRCSRRLRGATSGETQKIKKGKMNIAESEFSHYAKSNWGLSDYGFTNMVTSELKNLGIEVFIDYNYIKHLH